jgi:serine/threonine protein kinase
MAICSPTTITKLLKTAKTQYQTRDANPKSDAEQTHLKINQSLKQLKGFASKEESGADLEERFNGTKKGLLRQMKRYRKNLDAERPRDPNRQRLPDYLMHLAKIAIAATRLEFSTLDDSGIIITKLTDLPALTPEQVKLLESDDEDALWRANGSTKTAPPPSPEQAGATQKQALLKTVKALESIHAAAQKQQSFDSGSMAQLASLVEAARKMAAANDPQATARLNDMYTQAKSILKAHTERQANAAPATEAEEPPVSFDDLPEIVQQKKCYEKRLALAEDLIAKERPQFPPAEVERCQQFLETAKQQASLDQYEQAQANLQRAIGTIGARQVSKSAGEKIIKGMTAEQMEKLAAIDRSITARAQVNSLQDAERDQQRFTNQTQDKPRKVPVVEQGFGPEQAKALAASAKKDVNLSAVVQQGFSGLEKELNQAILPGAKKDILDRAQRRGKDLALALPSAFLVDALLKPPEQRKSEVVKGMGQLKDKYRDADFKQLSSDKQNLVKAICGGFDQVLEQAPSEAIQHCTAKAQDLMNQRLAELSPDSDEMFDLSMKSEADLIADAAVALGLVNAKEVAKLKNTAIMNAEKKAQDAGKWVAWVGAPYESIVACQLEWLEQLTPAQQAVVKAMGAGMAQAIDQNNPNKFNSNTNSVQLHGAEYEPVGQLGKGGFGTVSRYKKKGTDNEFVVIKSLNFKAKRMEMERELRVHRLAMGGPDCKPHPNITPLKGLVRGDDGSLHMVMEEAKGGNLLKTTEMINLAVAGGLIPSAAAQVLTQDFVRDAVAGLKFLQEQNLTHHDIKEENFLVTDDGRVMLADFGSGQIGQDEHGTVPGREDPDVRTAVSPGYVAPDFNALTTTPKADTYSLGIMIDKLTGGAARRGKAAEKKVGAPINSLDRLTQAMRDEDPQKRPTLEAIEKSSFLLDAGTHDEDQVAALKTAVMNFSEVARAGGGKKINGDLSVTEKELQSSERFLRAAVSALDQTRARHRLEEEPLRQEIARYDQEPAASAQRNAAQQELDALLQTHAKDITGGMSEVDKCKKELAELRQKKDALKAALEWQMRQTPEGEKAVEQLKAAAAPFAGTSEDPKKILPVLMKRWQAVVGGFDPYRPVIQASPLYLTLTVKTKAFLDAYDKGDFAKCHDLVRALEDFIAFASGNKDVAALMDQRATLVANMVDPITAEEHLPQIQTAMDELDQQIAQLLEPLLS